MTSAVLGRASDTAFKRLEEAGGDLQKLPEPFRTVVIIYSAQGVIDNGGFRCFFEGDWPGQPPYSSISDAHRRIGADVAAECIARAAALLPFADPHLGEDRRHTFLESLPENSELFTLGDSVCGDKTVWGKLDEFVQRHTSAF